MNNLFTYLIENKLSMHSPLIFIVMVINTDIKFMTPTDHATTTFFVFCSIFYQTMQILPKAWRDI